MINKDMKGKKPLFIGVLNGSFIFASDLLKQIKVECDISFIKLASYEGSSSSGKVKEMIGLNENIKNRTVIILEDIVDTGATIDYIYKQLTKAGVAEIKIATLLFKAKAYTKDYPIDYTAIVAPTNFLVGYGLDYNGLGRNLTSIYALDYNADEQLKRNKIITKPTKR
jgi:hypoxanthine phosphoribosyltransferase